MILPILHFPIGANCLLAAPIQGAGWPKKWHHFCSDTHEVWCDL